MSSTAREILNTLTSGQELRVTRTVNLCEGQHHMFSVLLKAFVVGQAYPVLPDAGVELPV